MFASEGPAAYVRSVNVGTLEPNPAKGGSTGFAKRPVTVAVAVRAPGSQKGRSGLEGDSIGDRENHGGDDQAVYAFAREDLDRWERELGRVLPDGSFGENLTVPGVDPNAALIGEQWRIGEELVLQVTSPRLPCKTFASRMGVVGWAKRFGADGRPGGYLRVVRPGTVQAGDPVRISHRPDHNVSVSMAFSAFTTSPGLLKGLFAAGDDLSDEMRVYVHSKLT
jgi:MOSC domain-containing protein YiiM